MGKSGDEIIGGFLKKCWKYILLFALIGAITLVIISEIPYKARITGDCYNCTWADYYWFLTFVIPSLVLLIITWKNK